MDGDPSPSSVIHQEVFFWNRIKFTLYRLTISGIFYPVFFPHILTLVATWQPQPSSHPGDFLETMTGPSADLVFSGERQEETRPLLRALGVLRLGGQTVKRQ